MITLYVDRDVIALFPGDSGVDLRTIVQVMQAAAAAEVPGVPVTVCACDIETVALGDTFEGSHQGPPSIEELLDAARDAADDALAALVMRANARRYA